MATTLRAPLPATAGLLVVVVVVVVVVVAAAPVSATKTWLRNTDWANAANWDGGRVPCSRDRAVLPGWLSAAVRLPEGDTAVAELLLPHSGELLLPADGALLLAGDAHAAPDCPGQDVVFSRVEPAAWLDEKSWRQEASVAAALEAGALPHLERVPCMLERAVFPAGSSFLVRLPEVPVGVGVLEIDGEEVDQEWWRALVESEPGRRQFRSPEGWLSEAVSVAGDSCRLAAGCPCQRPLVLPAVCRHAAPCAPPQLLPCLRPVTPRGHCCPMCGAYLLLDVDIGTFWLQRLRSTLSRLLPEGVVPWASNVDVAAHSLLVQVVLADAEGFSGASADAAQDLAEALLAEPNLGVLAASVQASGPELRGGAALALFAFMVGALAAVLLLMAGLFFLFVYRHGQSLQGDGRPFVFARFENTDQEDSHVSVVAPPPPEKAFDNPMYGKGAAGGDTAVSQEERKAALSAATTYTELQSRVDTQELVDVDIGAAAAAASSDV
ncbi:protein amnionless [Schistocerca cancellata]|uniref:protein amnionless n=1 Tax=Schistocerca cancellata TaxID=274614 RepID=UPI00211962BA|nr:protein amnionless [Schistocerca cancellata]